MACFGSNPDCCIQPQFSKAGQGNGREDWLHMAVRQQTASSSG